MNNMPPSSEAFADENPRARDHAIEADQTASVNNSPQNAGNRRKAELKSRREAETREAAKAGQGLELAGAVTDPRRYRAEAEEVARRAIHPTVLKHAIDALVESLDAERTYWDGTLKKWVQAPDWKTRQTASRTLLEFGLGRPVERSESVVVTTGVNPAELLNNLLKSPEARRQLQAQLDELEGNS